jgi:hypothetical protein
MQYVVFYDAAQAEKYRSKRKESKTITMPVGTLLILQGLISLLGQIIFFDHRRIFSIFVLFIYHF